MKKNIFLGFFLILALAASGLTQAASQVNLRYMIWDANQAPAMEASIQEFMKRNPNIKVSLEIIEWSDYWTRITTGLAARNLPDVFWGHLAYFSGLITRGGIMDLTPYIERDGIDLSIYYESLVKNWQYEGRQYGIPKDWDTITIFYNKDAFDRAGVPYPSEDWTWNPQDGGEFLQICQRLTIDEAGRNATDKDFDPRRIKQYGIGAIDGHGMQTGWLNFIWMNGGTGILDKPYGNKFVMDEPEAIEALQFWADLVSKYHVAPLPEGDVGTAAWDLFRAERIAMIPNGSWMLAAARELEFRWDVVTLPAGPAGRFSCFNGLAHNMSRWSNHLEEAWQLVKWMDGYESQKIITEFGVVFPAIPDLIPYYMEATKEKGPDNIQAFIEMTANAGLWPMHHNWAQMADVIEREVEMAIMGAYSAREAVRNIKMEIEPFL